MKRSLSSQAVFAVLVCAIVCSLLFLTSRTGNARRLSNKQAIRQQKEGKRSEAFETRWREIDPHINDSRFLLTRAAVFDPLGEAPEPVSIGQKQLAATRNLAAASNAVAQAEAPSGYFIVQYRGAIKSAWRMNCAQTALKSRAIWPTTPTSLKRPQPNSRRRRKVKLRFVGLELTARG